MAIAYPQLKCFVCKATLRENAGLMAQSRKIQGERMLAKCLLCKHFALIWHRELWERQACQGQQVRRERQELQGHQERQERRA